MPSPCRWAMEALVLQEMDNYQDSQENVMLMLSKGIGLCGIDKLLYDDGTVSYHGWG